MLEIQFTAKDKGAHKDIVVLCNTKGVLKESSACLPKDVVEHVDVAMEKSSFSGKFGETESVICHSKEVCHIILIGTEKDGDEDYTELDIQRLGGKITAKLNAERIDAATVYCMDGAGGFSADFEAAHLGYGARLRAYDFGKYFTKRKEKDTPSLHTLEFACPNPNQAKKGFDPLAGVAGGVELARNVVSEPPNVLHPESYADTIKEMTKLGVKVEILGEKEMAKLGMHSLLGVGLGSRRESKLVIMQWNNAPKTASKQPIAFVGKGVTFDTGGISLKPSANMDEMKYDMGGSAAVVGVMHALAARKAEVNAIGVVGLVENMPDGQAQRPGDIVTSMSGQTIEVLNTDAEGRLVLADALWYTQDRFKPRFMVNLATLTGAIVVALGSQHGGLFSNDDELSARLEEAGKQSGEKLWRFPLGPEYDKQIDSKVADMQNIGNAKGAGSITAAQFLQRFVNDVPWAHLDIAGMAWAKKASDVVPAGASGFGVRLLDQLVRNHYEG